MERCCDVGVSVQSKNQKLPGFKERSRAPMSNEQLASARNESNVLGSLRLFGWWKVRVLPNYSRNCNFLLARNPERPCGRKLRAVIL